MKIYFVCANLWFLFCGGKLKMCCQNIRKNFIPFLLSLVFGVTLASNFRSNNQITNGADLTASKNPIDLSVLDSRSSGNGIGSSRETSSAKSSASCIEENTDSKNYKSTDYPLITKSLYICSKPKVSYTDTARENNIQGIVILRVTFTAQAKIKNISVVQGLPDGLTEQAIAAAREIKFEPATKNGVPQAVTKQIQFTFTIY